MDPWKHCKKTYEIIMRFLQQYCNLQSWKEEECAELWRDAQQNGWWSRDELMSKKEYKFDDKFEEKS